MSSPPRTNEKPPRKTAKPPIENLLATVLLMCRNGEGIHCQRKVGNCCSLCDIKEQAGAKVKRENNLQGDRSFNDLQNMLFLVSSLAQVAKEQMTVLGRFGVHIL